MYTVSRYISAAGSCPFKDWIARLTPSARRAVVRAVERMKLGNLGDHKSVGAGVLERRIHQGPGYRIYFGRDGDELIILLGGGTKKRQATDIRRAQQCWADYKLEKD